MVISMGSMASWYCKNLGISPDVRGVMSAMACPDPKGMGSMEGLPKGTTGPLDDPPLPRPMSAKN